MTRRKLLLQLCLLSAVAFGPFSGNAQAGTPDDPTFDAHIVDMPFSAALDVLERELGVQFVGERVTRQRLTGLQLNGTSDQVINTVMQAASMDAFTFNGQVYYAPAEERTVRLITLGKEISAKKALHALDAAGLLIPGFDVSEIADGAALVMSGPVRYLALSEGVIGALAVTPDDAETPVRVRRAGILETDRATALSGQTSTEN